MGFSVAWPLRNLTIRLGDWSEKHLRASNSAPKYEHFPTLTSFQTAWFIASSSNTRNCSTTEVFQRKNVEFLSSKMQFLTLNKLDLFKTTRPNSYFALFHCFKTHVMANYKCACVCDLTASLGTSMLKITHGGWTSAVERSARRTRGRYTKDMAFVTFRGLALYREQEKPQGH